MLKGRPVWQIVLIVLSLSGIGYYIIKTMVLEKLSDTLDAIILMISCVILAIFAYFFQQKKER